MAIQLKSDLPEKQETQVNANGEVIEVEPEKKDAKSVISKVLLGLSIATFIFTLFLAIAPFLYFVLYFVAIILVLLVIVLPTICTLGLIWTSEGYRDFNEKVLGIFSELTSNESADGFAEFITIASKYTVIIGGIITAVSLIFMIVVKVIDKNKDTDKKARMIAMIIIAVLFVIAAFVPYALSGIN